MLIWVLTEEEQIFFERNFKKYIAYCTLVEKHVRVSIIGCNIDINMDKFKNKYRIQSHRKPNWDYSSDSFYFLTIVVQNRKCILGKIENQQMLLSDFGNIVETEWLKSFEIRNELFLHEYIIMPNHLHTIVEIKNDGTTDYSIDVETHGRVSLPIQTPIPIRTPISTEIQTEFIDKNLQIKRNAPIRLPKSISSFIAGFKSSINTKIDDYIDEHHLPIPKYNRNNHFFQSNYHDHIIRNNIEYKNIQKYIQNNPQKWDNDKFNDNNL